MTDLQNKRNKQAAKQSAMPFKTAFTVFFAAVFWLLPDTAKAVSSRTFDSMYAAAARGDVPALREAMHRGLRIDAVNRSGDTGVCAASNVRTTGHTTLSCRPAHAPTRPALPASTVPNMKNLSIPTKLSFMPATNIRRRRNAGAGQLLFPFRLCFRPADGHHPAGTGLYGTTGNAYNLLYLPVSLLFSFFPENHIDKHIFPSNQRIPEHQ